MSDEKRPRAPRGGPDRVTDPDPVRRRVLQGLGAVMGTALGCGSDGDAPGTGASGATSATGNASTSSGGPGAGGGGGAGSGAGGAGAGGAGGSGGGVDHCTGNGGLSPEELLAPIDTVVVLCMENRSFDHFLGALRFLEGVDVVGLAGNESNPDPDGQPVGVFKLDNFTPVDPPHNWDPVHNQWNQGLNDGFVIEHAIENPGVMHEVMGYHVRQQLPITYALADTSAICDAWYCSVLGPTWPNRFYLHAATAEGKQGNTPTSGLTSIFDLLEDAGLTHTNYYSDVPWCSGAYFKFGGLSGIENFFAAAEAGTLPNFSLLDPQFFGDMANDDHPDHDVQLGQALIAAVYAALAASPQWSRCLLVVTYDEHGGFYDHVAPPATSDERPEFEQLGFRVPSIVAGPYVRQGCAVTTRFEHVSVIKTLTTRFGLPSMNQRVDATNDLSSCIDPTTLRDPRPPVRLPQLDMSMSKLWKPRRAIHHPELWAMAESGAIPRHLDRRRDGDAIGRRVLSYGERLGVVRVRR